MYIIAGLGNPGTKYKGTRHNVGFEVIKALSKEYLPGHARKKFEARILNGRIKGEEVLLMRPQTFMNNSGIAIRQAADFYKVPADHILVIYDDVALPLGTLRLRKSGSAGGHNGVKSIIAHLGSQDFPRIRIGVGAAKNKELIDYVLGDFSKADKPVIQEAIQRAAEAVVCMLSEGMDTAMNRFNGPAVKETD